MQKFKGLNNGPTKPFTEYDDQLDLLISRGLIVNDREFALSVLKRISYYRLSAYSLTLRQNDVFFPCTTFETIYELYDFDKALRQIVMSYSQIVEVTFRARISHFHAKEHTPTGYLDSNNFENVNNYAVFISTLNHELGRSDDKFVEHHVDNLNSVFPIWAVMDVTSFGTLSKFYKNMLLSDRVKFAKTFTPFGREYVENWLQAVSYIRNVAAHNGRFYGRMLRSVPVRLNKKTHPGVNNRSLFANIIALFNLLPEQDIKQRFIDDLSKNFLQHPSAELMRIGFPTDWKNHLK